MMHQPSARILTFILCPMALGIAVWSLSKPQQSANLQTHPAAADRKGLGAMPLVGSSSALPSAISETDPEPLQALAQSFAREDPQLGLALALKMEDLDLREIFLIALFEEWGKLDGKTAAIAALDLDLLQRNPERQYALSAVARGWGQTSPTTAASWLLEQDTESSPTNSLYRQAMVNLFSTWGISDPSQALHWLRDVHSQGTLLSSELFQALAASWAQTSPQAALEAIAGLDPEELSARSGLIAGTLLVWSSASPQEASAWLQENLSPNELPLFADTIKMLGINLNDVSPEQAFELANEIPQPELREQMLKNLTFDWTREHPGDAIASFRDRLENDEAMRIKIVASAVRDWAHRKPFAAAEWIAQFPLGDKEADLAAYSYADAVNTSHPEPAAQISADIANDDMRNKAFSELAGYWVHQEPEQCLQFFTEKRDLLSPQFTAELNTLLRDSGNPQLQLR